jgi:hypothetical protein
MFGKSFQLKFVLLMAFFVALAMFMGSDPWGPI